LLRLPLGTVGLAVLRHCFACRWGLLVWRFCGFASLAAGDCWFGGSAALLRLPLGAVGSAVCGFASLAAGDWWFGGLRLCFACRWELLVWRFSGFASLAAGDWWFGGLRHCFACRWELCF